MIIIRLEIFDVPQNGIAGSVHYKAKSSNILSFLRYGVVYDEKYNYMKSGFI